MKAIKPKVLLLSIVTSVVCSGSVNAECHTYERRVVGSVKYQSPFSLEEDRYCNSDYECTSIQLMVSADKLNNVNILKQQCKISHGESKCTDWAYLVAFSPDASKSGQEASYHLDHPTLEGSKINYLFRSEDITVSGSESKVIVEESRTVDNCLTYKPKVFRKTIANEVRDELNPYQGSHPDALYEVR